MVRDLTVSTLHPRYSKITYTPPFHRLPRWERMFWPAFMFFGVFAVPAWITYHLPDYRGGLGLHTAYIKKQQREAEEATPE